ncbi:MAG: hypothetical protein KIS88_07770 [Anaerolineales bacterium]|nr:hypothetical protein [Anaerolineales bacterium]
MPSQPEDQIVEAIQQALRTQRPLVVALDGRSGAGKSTLAPQVAARLGDCCLIQGDDFYSGGSAAEWDRRSAEQKAQLCMDWQRLRNEALLPLLAGQIARWHPFNFETGAGLAEDVRSASPAAILLIDGVYSGRPELADLVHLTILMETEDAERGRRLFEREGLAQVEWQQRWDAGEAYYFEHIKPRQSFDLVVRS